MVEPGSKGKHREVLHHFVEDGGLWRVRPRVTQLLIQWSWEIQNDQGKAQEEGENLMWALKDKSDLNR